MCRSRLCIRSQNYNAVNSAWYYKVGFEEERENKWWVVVWWCSVKSGGVILAFIVTQFSCLGNLQVVRGSFKEKPLTMPKGCSLTTLFVFFFTSGAYLRMQGWFEREGKV